MTEGALPTRLNAVPIAEELDAADDIPPPAYGEHHDQLQLSQAGFAADAAVTADGRVNINISEKNRRLSELLAPTLKRQLRAGAQLPSEPLPPAYIPPSLGGQPGQTPPPRLNVVIQIVGSRGDVQPFVALGQVLRDTYGHRVRLATHVTFKSFVEENGLEFFNIGGDPAELMAFMVKNPGLMPGLDTIKSGEIKKRRQGIEEILMGCWRSCIEAGDGMGIPPPPRRADEMLDEQSVLPIDPGNRPFVADAIIANPPSFAHIHIAEKLGIPLHMMFTMPWTPTRAFPHPLADVTSTNIDAVMTSYISYALVEMMTWQGLGDMINRFRTSILDLDPISLLWAPGLLTRLRIPTTYCWSPALTPKPADWANEITVAGFYFLNLESAYTPEPDLAAFLQAGPPPIYIGFGSIVVDDPDALTRTIFQAIAMTGVRALVSKGWGGIGGDAIGVPDGVFMLGNCPHDWLFKRVSAVVHHGGAGTTAAGVKAGRPTVVVPFFGDQIFWGTMIAKAGAGPAPIPHKKLTAENLAAAITEALRPETKARAQELGEKIREEKGADVGGKSFHQFLNADNMRCWLAPSRVAVWRVRRTKVRLSALAAAVLVKEGRLKYSDLKLYRPVEYNTEDQPWDPISAVVSALVGDFSHLTMALADFPREIFKGAQTKKGKANDSTPTPLPRDGIANPSTASLLTNTSGGAMSSVDSLAASTTSSVETLPSTLSPQQTQHQQQSSTSTANPVPPPAPKSPLPRDRSPSSNPVNLDLALATGKGALRIVSAGMKTPSNFCLGLARGFRNAPKLYNDETVRPSEKVTGLASGVKVAGKEFGLGLYDGLSGLVTHPWKGAEREGGRGLLKGFGKGIGGVVLKPAAGFWGVPGYLMQGVRVEMRGWLAGDKAGQRRWVVTERIRQGLGDYEVATEGERRDVLARWGEREGGEELKGFWGWKKTGEEAEAEGPLRAKWLRGKDGLTAVAAAAERRKKSRSTASAVSLAPPTTASSASSDSNYSFEGDEALERAIRESVQQTSTGDSEEDARIEAAVRASVQEMQRAAEQGRGKAGWQAMMEPGAHPEAAHPDQNLTDITDEEYQALIEEAVRLSLLEQQREQWGSHHSPADEKAGLPGYPGSTATATETERRESAQPVFELPGDLPRVATTVANASPEHGSGSEEDEEGEERQLRRALEESEREHRGREEELQRQRTEEEIVLEYVKRQSLAEEEYRRAAGKRKGKGAATGESVPDEDEDEDLRRAVEESLKMSGRGGGPSRS
ncbi:hypothetical protein MFIFM68171_01059 [Madurella fahalii]|uniref:Glycosyltransferase family 28 N-terminal domain-containing protein n=1 Tax=Madurella fahalii TaxID=1157608 RepID=A0ABQ0FZB3_9PEZI